MPYILILFLSATQSITPMANLATCERVALAAMSMVTTGDRAWRCVPVGEEP